MASGGQYAPNNSAGGFGARSNGASSGFTPPGFSQAGPRPVIHTRAASPLPASAYAPPAASVPAAVDPLQDVHGDPAVWLPRLKRLLVQQIELYKHLDVLSQEQASLIEQGKADELIELLAQRQNDIDAIADTNAELVPFQKDWGKLVSLLKDEDRTFIREQMAVLSDLAKRISQRDERDRQAMEQRRDDAKRSLNVVSKGRNAVHTYAKPSQMGELRDAVTPRYQDRSA